MLPQVVSTFFQDCVSAIFLPTKKPRGNNLMSWIWMHPSLMMTDANFSWLKTAKTIPPPTKWRNDSWLDMTQDKHLLSLLNFQITRNQPNKNDISRAQNTPNLPAGWPDYARNSGLWDPMSLRFGPPSCFGSPRSPPFSYKISRQNPRGPFPKPLFWGKLGKL